MIRDGYPLIARFDGPSEQLATPQRDARTWAYRAIAWVKCDRPTYVPELPTPEDVRQADPVRLEEHVRALLSIVERG